MTSVCYAEVAVIQKSSQFYMYGLKLSLYFLYIKQIKTQSTKNNVDGVFLFLTQMCL